MVWYDWAIVVVSFALLLGSALLTRGFANSVSGFLAAERCGGRYMISVSNGMSGLCVITMMYFFQICYDTGFSTHWWMQINDPMFVILGITGWVVFRFRQTRAMTLAEFFEMRYSRPFRVFSGLLAFISGILNFGIFPSIGAKFFIYFCGLPKVFMLPGLDFQIQTYAFVMVVLLVISAAFIFIGGQITIMFTDFIQGIFTSLIFAVIIAYLFFAFSKTEMSETLLTAASGHSLVNPYDLGKEENFNITYYLIALFMTFYLALCWQGSAGYNCCARTPHEAKMAYMLTPLRQKAILPVIVVLIPIVIHVYMKHDNFAMQSNAVDVRVNQLIKNDLSELAKEDSVRKADLELLSQLNAQESDILLSVREESLDSISSDDYADSPLLKGKNPEDVKSLAQLYHDKTNEMKNQILIPLVIGKVIPKGLAGLLCAAMLFAFISTHNTYMHSWGSMFMQDVVLPFRKKPLSDKAHIWLLRLAIFLVAVFIFCFSLFFKHSQRIMMYCQITASIFIAGAGSVIIGGLYWKKGTAKAAWATMISGLMISVSGFFMTQSGPSAIDTALMKPFWQNITNILAKVQCDEIFWNVARKLFSMNAQENLFMNSCICIGMYTLVSLLTSKDDFNMDKLLHRGKYSIKGDDSATLLEAKSIWNRLGFTQDFTKSDYAVAGVSLGWPFVWLIVFIIGTIFRNKISDMGWFNYWYIWMWIMFVSGVATIVWFAVGGLKDMALSLKILKGQKQDESFISEEAGCELLNNQSECPLKK